MRTDKPRAGLHRPGIHPACRPTTHVVPSRQALFFAKLSIFKAYCAQATFSCACRVGTTTTHPQRPQAGHAGPAQPDALSAYLQLSCSPPGADAKQQCHTSTGMLCSFDRACSDSVRVPFLYCSLSPFSNFFLLRSDLILRRIKLVHPSPTTIKGRAAHN